MSPAFRFYSALVLIVICAVGWPLSAFFWAKDEPQFILGLSWGAILFTAIDIALTAEHRKVAADEKEEEG